MAMKDNDTPELNPAELEAARSVAVLLPQLEEGAFNAEVSDQFRDLIARMRDHGINGNGRAKGKLAITIDVTLDDGVFELRADFKVTAPKSRRGRSVFWATDGNNLTPENPKQMAMFGLRKVDTPDARKVEVESGALRKV